VSPCAQGYIQYRIAGEPHRLDVDTLNEKLRLRGAARMRLLMRPDEAYGMIFDFDGQPRLPLLLPCFATFRLPAACTHTRPSSYLHLLGLT
jgi:hypothetical protein